MDRLKKYLKDNEAYMEVDRPDENSLWDRIEQGSPGKPAVRARRLPVMRYAAAACIILLAGTGLMLLLRNPTKPAAPPAIVKSDPPAVDTPRHTQQPVAIVTAPAAKKDIPSIEHTQASVPAQDMASTPNEVDNIGQGYTRLIQLQLKNLRNNTLYARNPGYFSFFRQQLKQMDKDEAAIRRDMQLYGTNDALLEQLINVYQQKLNLLKNLRTEINKMNNYLHHINI
jgi:hypothetical protein